MGRADVLLRFLQLVGKDRPLDIEEYLVDLHPDTERRPIVDQIVDRILAVDPALYDVYAQARREVGARNPYASVEEQPPDAAKVQALGYFLTKWIALEQMFRRFAGERDRARPDFEILRSNLWQRFEPEMRWEFEQVRRLRNQAVHGIEPPTEEDLRRAANLIDRLLAALEHVTTDRGRGEPSSSNP